MCPGTGTALPPSHHIRTNNLVPECPTRAPAAPLPPQGCLEWTGAPLARLLRALEQHGGALLFVYANDMAWANEKVGGSPACAPGSGGFRGRVRWTSDLPWANEGVHGWVWWGSVCTGGHKGTAA